MNTDLSIPRKYYQKSTRINVSKCPRCQSTLVNEYLPYLILAQLPDKSKQYYLMGNKGGNICLDCQTIVLDYETFQDELDELEQITKFIVIGIINVESSIKIESSIEVESEYVPVTPFTNSIITFNKVNKKSKKHHYQKERKEWQIDNNLCLCGSGKTFNECCMRNNRINLPKPRIEDLSRVWFIEGVEDILAREMLDYFRDDIFSYLEEEFASDPEENANLLPIFVDEIHYNRFYSKNTRKLLLDQYELEIDISESELLSLKKVFPKILSTLKKEENSKSYHPFNSIMSCILMNNVPNITDQIPALLEFIKSLSPANRLSYSHWLISIGHHKPELLLPLLNEIIKMGIFDENVLIILSFIAKVNPDKVANLVPKLMNEDTMKGKYYFYRFLSSFAQKRPEILAPYVERLEKEVKTFSDVVELQECLSYYKGNIKK